MDIIKQRDDTKPEIEEELLISLIPKNNNDLYTL